MQTSADFDAVVVGAGFAGLHMLHWLRGMGLSVRVLEAQNRIGGRAQAIEHTPHDAHDRTYHEVEQNELEDPAGHLLLPDVGVRGLDAFERLRRRARLLGSGRDGQHALPRLGGPLEVLLAEGADDAHVQQRLGVLRIDHEGAVELRERLVRLVHVVVRDAEVGAGVDVARIDLQRRFVPLGRFLEPAASKYMLPSARGDGVRRVLLRVVFMAEARDSSSGGGA